MWSGVSDLEEMARYCDVTTGNIEFHFGSLVICDGVPGAATQPGCIGDGPKTGPFSSFGHVFTSLEGFPTTCFLKDGGLR
jgi:hypothetical protein